MKRWLDDVRRDAIRKLRQDKSGRKKLEDTVDGIMELYDIRREKGLLALEEAVQLLGIKMNELPDLCVQRLVRDVDCHDLAGCVYAFDQEMRTKVLENPSTRYREAVEEEAVKWWSVDEESLAASVNKVIDTIRIFGERGEFAL